MSKRITMPRMVLGTAKAGLIIVLALLCGCLTYNRRPLDDDDPANDGDKPGWNWNLRR